MEDGSDEENDASDVDESGYGGLEEGKLPVDAHESDESDLRLPQCLQRAPTSASSPETANPSNFKTKRTSHGRVNRSLLLNVVPFLRNLR